MPAASTAEVRTVPYGPEPDQFAELWSAQGEGLHPVVVLLHGGYWRNRYGLNLMHAIAADLQARGIATWNVEYRRVGSPGGGWPGTFDDVSAAFDRLTEQALTAHLDLGRVAIVGHSAGGHLGLWLAAQRQPAVVVALAAICDLAAANRLRLSGNAVAEFLGGDERHHPERYRKASPAALLPLGVRQILVHGTADEDVPFTLSADYHAAARAAGDDCVLLDLADVDHFALIDPGSSAWQVTVRRLEEVLRLP